MARRTLKPSEIVAEFADVRLGDGRLDRRLLTIAAAIAAKPSASFPSAAGGSAEREALYRFFKNERVTLHGLLEGHIAQTLQRVSGKRRIRIVHDTTSLVYRGEREGNGPIKGAGQGFFAHVALAVAGDEGRSALGVLNALTYAHEKDSPRKQLTRSEQAMATRALPREERLSYRWEATAFAVHNSLPSGIEAVHVMDQEADDFILMAELVEAGISFVIRGSGTRLTATAKESVAMAMAAAKGTVFRRITLNPRAVHRARGKGRPARAERDAKLSVRWSEITIARPDNVGADRPRALTLKVVHVFEPKPPKGEEPIEWYLFTTDEVDSLEDATRVIDDYRARWVIEEYFKALKTGCAVEKRQLTSFDGLNRVLGLLMPIAWRLLFLRQLSREPTPPPGSAAMTDDELQLLGALLVIRRSDFRLPAKPTVRHVMFGLAALGGHIRNNGNPGWIVLGRGHQLFLDAQLGWSARSDQS